MRAPKTRVWFAMIAAVALIAAACGDGDGEPGAGATDGTPGDGAAQGGQTINLLHGISGEQEQAALQQAIDAYQESSGNTVQVEPSAEFETVIATRVEGGNPPDVALYPQPGLLERFLDTTTPLSEAGVDVQSLSDELVEGMVDTGTFEDTEYGVVVKVGLKSLLWYGADDFEEAGYSAPESWQDMLDLSDQIASEQDGQPWCIGIESGEATGWVATDWIEDIVLRMHGPDVYDQWVNHEIEFQSDEIRSAFEELENIWFNEEWVLGGTTGILNTPFGDAAQPMFDDPPGCWMHRQAGFIAGNFPEDAQIGQDFDVVYFPSMEGEEQPVLFAGDLAAVHTDNPAAGDFVQFLASQEGQEAWMSHEGAGSLSSRADFDNSQYPTEALQKQGEIFSQASVARFDASDLMPSEVGAGAFWREIVAWISGSQDLDATLQNIDQAWPAE